MIENSYYSQDVHGPYELHDIGNLDLEEGGTIRACKLAYATFGKLNAAKDNAVLIPTWYSGTNKIIEQVYVGQAAPSIPTSISSLSSIRLAVVFHPHRTIHRCQPGWEIFPMCASGMTCVRNTNFSRKNST